MLRLRKLVSKRRLQNLVVHRQLAAGEFRQALVDERPFGVRIVLPGTRLVVAIAPALTIGLVRPSGMRSMPATELKA